MTDEKFKICPKCQARAPLQARSCALCGHAYSTRFDANGNPIPNVSPTRQTPVSATSTVNSASNQTASKRFRVPYTAVVAAVAVVVVASALGMAYKKDHPSPTSPEDYQNAGLTPSQSANNPVYNSKSDDHKSDFESDVSGEPGSAEYAQTLLVHPFCTQNTVLATQSVDDVLAWANSHNAWSYGPGGLDQPDRDAYGNQQRILSRRLIELLPGTYVRLMREETPEVVRVRIIGIRRFDKSFPEDLNEGTEGFMMKSSLFRNAPQDPHGAVPAFPDYPDDKWEMANSLRSGQ